MAQSHWLVRDKGDVEQVSLITPFFISWSLDDHRLGWLIMGCHRDYGVIYSG